MIDRVEELAARRVGSSSSMWSTMRSISARVSGLNSTISGRGHVVKR
ncbi:hypothetical protein AB0F43_20840 [Kribbella sp. NPDC023972]